MVRLNRLLVEKKKKVKSPRPVRVSHVAHLIAHLVTSSHFAIFSIIKTLIFPYCSFRVLPIVRPAVLWRSSPVVNLHRNLRISRFNLVTRGWNRKIKCRMVCLSRLTHVSEKGSKIIANLQPCIRSCRHCVYRDCEQSISVAMVRKVNTVLQ